MTTKSPAALLMAQAKRMATYRGDIVGAHKELVRLAEADAVEITSGGTSTRQLRAMGHPFGRGKSGGMRGNQIKGMKRKVSPLPINRQTGGLQRSRFLRGPSGADLLYRLGHAAPYAKYILSPTGTSRMVARGYFDEIKARHRARRQGLFMAARAQQARP